MKYLIGTVACFILLAGLALLTSAIIPPEGVYAGGECIGVETPERLASCENEPHHDAVHIAPEITRDDIMQERFNQAVARGDEIEELFPDR